MNELVQNIQKEIGKVIKGKDEVIAKILMAILAKGNVLMEDVPGVGKTTMAMAFARTMGLDTKRIQFTPDTMPSDILGFTVYDKNTGALTYKHGAVITNLLLADEINRTSSKTQSALLEAMEEKKITVEGKTYILPDPFVVLATQNPVGSAGTVMLPNSQLDRFMIKINMGYPDLESQVNILCDRHNSDPLDRVVPAVTKEQLKQLIKETNNVRMDREVYEYAARLAEGTRKHEMSELGISPRGTLALCRMAKAHAFASGRDYVIPFDIQDVFQDVCGHRMILSSKARLNEYTAEQLLDEVLHSVDAPAAKEIKTVKDMQTDAKAQAPAAPAKPTAPAPTAAPKAPAAPAPAKPAAPAPTKAPADK